MGQHVELSCASAQTSSDFISIYLHHGHVVFAYDCGSGVVTLKSDRVYTDFEWHTVRVFHSTNILTDCFQVVAQRHGRHGVLQIDASEVIRGESPGVAETIETVAPVYVGAVAEERLNDMKTLLPVGCISSMK